MLTRVEDSQKEKTSRKKDQKEFGGGKKDPREGKGEKETRESSMVFGVGEKGGF